MGRVEKPLLLLHGRPLVQHVTDRLRPQVSHLLISANREHTAYSAFADAVIADSADHGGVGPLGGILAATPAVVTPWVFICPGDAPRIDRSIVSRLSAALTTSVCDAAIPHDGAQGQHLFLLLRRSALNGLREYLTQGRRSVHGFLESLTTTIVDASDIADSFLNINTVEELSAAHRMPHTME